MLNSKANHDRLRPLMRAAIDDAAANGVPNHEYSPTAGNDAIKELAKAMEICAV